MIELVHDKAGPFLSEAFLVNKPKDPIGPSRMVVDYLGLKHCFQRSPFNQTDPFTIPISLRINSCFFFVADMSQGYFQIHLIDGPEGSHVTTFICERGIFRWKVMPMGIQPASDSLSYQMQAVLGVLFRTDFKTHGSPMVKDLDKFLGGSETLEQLEDLLEDFLLKCHAGKV